MSRERVTLRTGRAWGTKDAPPREFRLFAHGPNYTTKGIFYLDAEHAEGCVNRWRLLGRPLAGDYNHGAAKASAQPVPASCYFGLEARPDGLWCVNIEWTPRATALFAAGEYRYFSAWFDMEVTKTGRKWIKEIFNFGLTNDPATIRAIPLVLERGDDMKEALISAIAAHLSATLPPEQAQLLASELVGLPEIAALLGESEPMPEGNGEAPEGDAPQAPALPDALSRIEARLSRIEADYRVQSAKMAALSVSRPVASPARKPETPEGLFQATLSRLKAAGISEADARIQAFDAARRGK